MHARALVLIGAIAALLASSPTAPSAGQQPRDRPAVGRAASGSIHGVVSSGDRPSRPLRRAQVKLYGSALGGMRETVTSDDGTFAFGGLPAGRYEVLASKEGFVAMSFGATASTRPGRSIELGTGRTARADIILPRGAVITGTLGDASGEPLSDIRVSVATVRFNTSSARVEAMPFGVVSAVTDDRGVYRIYGLPAGEYIVTATPGSTRAAEGNVEMVSTTELRRALAESRPASILQDRPGIPAPSPTARGPQVDEPRAARTLTAVYYPGTTSFANATRIAVKAGEERAGVDFGLQYVPVARVSGVAAITSPEERPLVQMVPSGDGAVYRSGSVTRAAPDGQFAFDGVPPGEYLIVATFDKQRDGDGRPGAGWTSVVVNGEDVSNIAISPMRYLKIAGRVVFDGIAPPMRIRQLPSPIYSSVLGHGTMLAAPTLQIADDGSFVLSGLIPGRMTLPSAQSFQRQVGRWSLVSVTANGRNLLDAPLAISEDITDAVVTLTSRNTGVAGIVRDGRGAARGDVFVVAFPADPAQWFPESWRITGVPVGHDGRYSIRGLPPGAYLIAASEDLLPNEWEDPEVLSRLARSATRITVGGQISIFDPILPDPGRIEN